MYHRNSWFTYSKWWVSIAMLVYQAGYLANMAPSMVIWKTNFGAAAAIYPCWLIRWGMILSYVIHFYPIYICRYRYIYIYIYIYTYIYIYIYSHCGLVHQPHWLTGPVLFLNKKWLQKSHDWVKIILHFSLGQEHGSAAGNQCIAGKIQ